MSSAFASVADLPEAVAGYLRRHNLPMRLVKAVDPHARQGGLGQNGLLDVRDRKAEGG